MEGKSFDFSLYERNLALEKTLGTQKFLKTGTTICAACFDGGAVLGADTRATAGPVVQVKDEMKIHRISDNIWACGAGTAADNDQITRLISSKITLFQMNTGIEPRVDQVSTIFSKRLFKYQGYIQAYLIVAGVDYSGSSIYTIYAQGSASKSPFAALGSGSMAAISVLEPRWRKGLNEDECRELVADAIEAGITNDLGSGSNVNICVIKRGKEPKFYKDYRVTNPRNFNWQTKEEVLQTTKPEVLIETVRPRIESPIQLEVFDGIAEPL